MDGSFNVRFLLDGSFIVQFRLTDRAVFCLPQLCFRLNECDVLHYEGWVNFLGVPGLILRRPVHLPAAALTPPPAVPGAAAPRPAIEP